MDALILVVRDALAFIKSLVYGYGLYYLASVGISATLFLLTKDTSEKLSSALKAIGAIESLLLVGVLYLSFAIATLFALYQHGVGYELLVRVIAVLIVHYLVIKPLLWFFHEMVREPSEEHMNWDL